MVLVHGTLTSRHQVAARPTTSQNLPHLSDLMVADSHRLKGLQHSQLLLYVLALALWIRGADAEGSRGCRGDVGGLDGRGSSPYRPSTGGVSAALYTLTAAG